MKAVRGLTGRRVVVNHRDAPVRQKRPHTGPDHSAGPRYMFDFPQASTNLRVRI